MTDEIRTGHKRTRDPRDALLRAYSRRDFLGRTTAAAGAISLAGLLAACGGDDDATEDTPAATGTAGTNGDSDAVARAQSEIDKYSQVPEFVPPGPAFDARAAGEGKTIYFIPVISAVPFVQVLVNSMTQIGEELGVTVVDWVNQGTPQEWIQGAETAITKRADAVDLMQVDPRLLEPQLQQLKGAGIFVNEVFNRGAGEDPSPLVTSSTNFPVGLLGQLMADWVITQTGGDGNALVLSVNETVISPVYVDGFVNEFSELCPDCESRVIDFPIAQVATRAQAQVQSALVADPSIKYVAPIYDELFIPSVLAAINTAGVGDRVKIVSSDGTPSALESIQEGDTVEMDVGFGIDWVAHAVIDQHLRNFAGLEAPTDAKVGVRVFSDENVDEAGVPPVFEKGYGDAYKQGYRELWQVA